MALARRWKPMDEAQCYLRCHGARSGLVTVLPGRGATTEHREVWYWPRPATVRVSGEELRRQFAERLERRQEAA
jgi:hypothetical protein